MTSRACSTWLLFVAFLVSACASAPPESIDRIQDAAALPEELASFSIQDTDENVEQPDTPAVPDVAKNASEEEKKRVEEARKAAAEKAKKKKKKKKKAKKKVPEFEYPNRRPSKDPIWVGERQSLEVTYFGVVAGLAHMDVLPSKVIKNRKVYHIKVHAKSSKLFSLFYTLDDSIESFFDYYGLFSHRYHLKLNESKQTRDALELYDSKKKQTFYWDRWNHHRNGFKEKKEYHPIEPFSQDAVSALYYLRGLSLPTGAEYEYPVVSEGKSWRLNVKVVRREAIDTEPFGRINAIVLKPLTKFNGVVQQRGDSFIWMSDDDRRFILRVEAKVKVGTVAAILKSVQRGSPP